MFVLIAGVLWAATGDPVVGLLTIGLASLALCLGIVGSGGAGLLPYGPLGSAMRRRLLLVCAAVVACAVAWVVFVVLGQSHRAVAIGLLVAGLALSVLAGGVALVAATVRR